MCSRHGNTPDSGRNGRNGRNGRRNAAGTRVTKPYSASSEWCSDP